MAILSTFELEKRLSKRGYNFIIGIDEAGRGPLAGPVVACAITVKKLEILNRKSEKNHKLFNLVRDSKSLSEKQREKLFYFIQENFYLGVGMCDHKTIDRINILEASFLAMKKAVAALLRNMKQKMGSREQKLIILVDGNKNIPNFSMEQKAVVGGDKFVKSISAASIIAKVTRDRIMREMHGKYPDYGFNQHKGYGTRLHIKMLSKFGPCVIHRRSFHPVSNLVKNNF